MKNLPVLKEFKLDDSPFPVVDPTNLPPDLLAALDKFMFGKTVSHSVYIYVQDWVEFRGAVGRGNIQI
ncbi:hypothetical protein [Vibrio splendidus]|uniref:hypothetical protein n=1 Tax=Vibrio splendidus TaxID=29497 RepID=UPI0000671345|nr:hypothetical protein [Vibrio splendidus]EAP93717.1 hypothetical protein V12B01_21716 [Vibrio splendidus 12B01]